MCEALWLWDCVCLMKNAIQIRFPFPHKNRTHHWINVTTHTGCRLVVYLVLWSLSWPLLLLLTLLLLILEAPPFLLSTWETERDRLTFSPTLINLSYTTLHIHLVNKAHEIIIDDTITNLHTCLHIKKQEREGEITLSKAPIGAVSYLFLWSLPSLPLLLTVLWVWDGGRFVCPCVWGTFCCPCVSSFSISIATQFNLESFYKFWCNKIEMLSWTANVCLIMFNVTKSTLVPIGLANISQKAKLLLAR